MPRVKADRGQVQNQKFRDRYAPAWGGRGALRQRLMVRLRRRCHGSRCCCWHSPAAVHLRKVCAETAF